MLATHSASILSNIHTNYKVKKYPDLAHDVNEAVEHDVAIFLANIFNK